MALDQSAAADTGDLEEVDEHAMTPGLSGSEKLVVLYRPVGQRELELIQEGGFRSFPPRLAHQPIFYPVLTEQYAIQIARDWNTKDVASGYVGYVTRFRVQGDFLARYPVRKVGGADALEYWIPAEELTEFNSNIIGLIEVIHQFESA